MTTPAPFLPAEIDLRDFPSLQIDIARLFSSEFHARSSDAEWRAGMTLWLKAFHQVPSGSLPGDDTSLARLAEFGRDQSSWLDVKDGALWKWVLCSDGRLYHRTVATKALEAWIAKVAQRKSGTIGNAKRWKTEADVSSYDVMHDRATAALTLLDPQSPTLRKARPPCRTPSPALDMLEFSGSGAHPIGLLSPPDPHPIAEGSQVKGSEGISPSEDKSSSGEGAQARSPARTRLDDSVSALSPSVMGDRGHGDEPGTTGGPGAEIVERPSRATAKPAVRRKRPETLWPDGLAMGDGERQFAEERGFRGTAAVRLWESFEARSKSRGATYVDWHAAWRSYVLKQIEFDARNGTRKATYADGRPRGRIPDI